MSISDERCRSYYVPNTIPRTNCDETELKLILFACHRFFFQCQISNSKAWSRVHVLQNTRMAAPKPRASHDARHDGEDADSGRKFEGTGATVMMCLSYGLEISK